MSFNRGWRGPNIVKDGIILYLDPGSPNSYYGGSGNTWKDISGNNYTSTLYNGPTYNSDNGGYLSFDGINDYCLTGYTQPTMNDNFLFSWNIWCYPVVSSVSPIIGNRGSFIPLNFLKLSVNQFEYACDGQQSNIYFSLSPGNWQNVCIVKDIDGFGYARIRYFYNKALIGSTYPTTIMGTNSVYIGGDVTASEYSNVRVGSVQIYNRPLTEAEIVINYNALSSRYI
jgi:hypothetical protein